MLPPARQVDLNRRLASMWKTPKDRTACSVCRFVRNTQKRCTITAGRLTLLGPVTPPSPSFLLVYFARFPFQAHENLQRPRVKVELTKPVLVRQRRRGRGRGNNNVETKESIYSSWGTVKISCFMCALDVNSSGSGSGISFNPYPVPYCVSVSSCLHLQPERRQCCRSFSLPPSSVPLSPVQVSSASLLRYSQFWQSTLAAFHHSCTLFEPEIEPTVCVCVFGEIH